MSEGLVLLTIILSVLMLTLWMRFDFRSTIRPFQIVGVKIKGKIINAPVLIVNKDTIVISHPETKERCEVELSNVYMPSFRE